MTAAEPSRAQNYRRNLFHLNNGLVAFFLYEFWLSRWQMVGIAAALLVFFHVLDFLRKRRPALNAALVARMQWLMRPEDAYRMPSSTWYTWGLLIGTALYPKTAIEAGALVLAVADPIASIAGRRWGRRRLYKDRTWFGSGAFAVAGTVVCFALLGWKLPQVPLVELATKSLIVGTAGALAELGSGWVDDNFTVPVIAGGVCTLLF